MLIPDLATELMKQRDAARWALQALAGEYQVALMDLRHAHARLTEAGQAAADEPIRQAPTLMDNLDPDHDPDSAWAKGRAAALACAFIDPAPPCQAPASTARPMPANALRVDKQAVGLLLP